MANYDINSIRENIQTITSGNVIRLITDFLIPNIDKIQNFNTLEKYFRNDIVYQYDSVNDKHNLYICNKDLTGPGNMVSSDWDNYTFRLQKSSIILESDYTALIDGVTNIPINLPLFDPDNDKILVFHSVMGRMRSTIDWKLNANKTSIDLQKISLYKNETIMFEIIK